MTKKQTSAKVSKIAARYLALDDDEWNDILELAHSYPRTTSTLLKDIKTLAASCLSQDETKEKPDGH